MMKAAPYIALALGAIALGTLVADEALGWGLSKEIYAMLAAVASGGLGWILKSPAELKKLSPPSA